MIAISLVLAFIEGDQRGNQQAPNVNICIFLLCRFYKVELKLNYRISHLKRYEVKQLRKMFKNESKESNCLLSNTL